MDETSGAAWRDESLIDELLRAATGGDVSGEPADVESADDEPADAGGPQTDDGADTAVDDGADTADAPDSGDESAPKARLARVRPDDPLPVEDGCHWVSHPSKFNPYHTDRGEHARADTATRIPDLWGEAADTLIAAGLGRAVIGRADYADHNAMCLAWGWRYSDCGLRVIDLHGLHNNGKPTARDKAGNLVLDAKRPRGVQWQMRASADRETITSFWTGDGEYPPTKRGDVFRFAPVTAPRNVGIATSGEMFVLDIDGDAGAEWLAEFEAEHGPLPMTCLSVTGSGGKHYLFRAPGREIHNSQSGIAPGVDIRGVGGYMVAPPSVHAATLNFYHWEAGRAPGECEIAVAPDVLIEAAIAAHKATAAAAGQTAGAKPKAKAKTGARSAGAAASAASERPEGSGVDFWLSRIGDQDEGLDGFHWTINNAACAWFAQHGADEDPAPLRKKLLDRIRDAPCRDGRNLSKYVPAVDDYIASARVYIAGQRAAEDGAPEDHDADPEARQDAGEPDQGGADVGSDPADDAADGQDAGDPAGSTDEGGARERDPGDPPPLDAPLWDPELVSDCWCNAEDAPDVREQILAAMRERFAYVILDGGEARVIVRAPSGVLPRLWQDTALGKFFSNRTVRYKVEGADKPKELKPAALFLSDPDRMTYAGTQFEPDPAAADPLLYNLFNGFPVHPRPGDWSLLRDHIRNNIVAGNCDTAAEDDALFAWLMTGMADIFQHPGRKLGTSVAICGEQGVGKSKLFDWLRRAFGAYATKVSRRDKVTGEFNSHLDSKLLVVAEEAFWSGDKGAAGALKDLITGETYTMTRKHVDSIERVSYLRFAFVSNEHWIIPSDTNADARRFLVLKASTDKKNDKAYFRAIDQQMQNGGLAAMVHDLMNWDPKEHGLDWDDLRTAPWTPARAEQASYGASPAWARLLRVIEDGIFVDGDGQEYELNETSPTPVPRRHLVTYLEGGKVQHGGGSKEAAAAIRDLLGEDAEKGDSKRDFGGGKRERWIEFPPLGDLRAKKRERYR